MSSWSVAWFTVICGVMSHGVAVAQPSSSDSASFTFATWSAPVTKGVCSSNATGVRIPITSKGGAAAVLLCALVRGSVKEYTFPPGVFEIGEQMLVPPSTALVGARSPTDPRDPTRSPNWEDQTLFLATRGATDYNMEYCHAPDMVQTRVGFVLSSHVTVRDLSYQGMDTIRPGDNGGLCGGGAFETKGCAENDCRASAVNNGGSDGVGSVNVVISNVRVNDYHFAEDRDKIGAHIAGNTDCAAAGGCCFCRSNGVRSSQVAVWVPQTRNAEGTVDLLVDRVVSLSTQADAINLHGYVRDAVVRDSYCAHTGDDVYVLWGADLGPENVTFVNNVAVNPGIMRPNWYGNCAATYGLKSLSIANLTCRAPTLLQPIPAPEDHSLRIDTSLLVVFTSFGGKYPAGNRLEVEGWTFEDLEGRTYTPEMGVMDEPVVGRMAWTRADADKGALVAPYYFPKKTQQVNVYVST